jgi:hypothetical protein
MALAPLQRDLYPGFVPLTLPLDLNPVMPIVLDSTPQTEQNLGYDDTNLNLNYYNSLLQIPQADHDIVLVINIHGRKKIRLNKPITINGQQYLTGRHLGGGEFGTCCQLNDLAGNPTNRSIKIQQFEDDHAKRMFIKEAIIQTILDRSTNNTLHYDCNYVPKIYTVQRINIRVSNAGTITNDVEYGLYEMEYVQGGEIYNKICQYIDAEVDPVVKENKKNALFEKLFVKLSRMFDVLYEFYQFNHGDFHFANFLGYWLNGPTAGVNRDFSVRLIDFGYSMLHIPNSVAGNPSLVIKNPYNLDETTGYGIFDLQRTHPARDITTLALCRFAAEFLDVLNIDRITRFIIIGRTNVPLTNAEISSLNIDNTNIYNDLNATVVPMFITLNDLNESMIMRALFYQENNPHQPLQWITYHLFNDPNYNNTHDPQHILQIYNSIPPFITNRDNTCIPAAPVLSPPNPNKMLLVALGVGIGTIAATLIFYLVKQNGGRKKRSRTFRRKYGQNKKKNDPKNTTWKKRK